MKSCLDLKSLSEDDERLMNLEVDIVSKDIDPLHVERRMQQKAITPTMIKIAIAYGESHRHEGASIYRLGDKHLVNTRYSKHIDKLRGLKVVLVGSSRAVLTAYRDVKWKK